MEWRVGDALPFRELARCSAWTDLGVAEHELVLLQLRLELLDHGLRTHVPYVSTGLRVAYP